MFFKNQRIGKYQILETIGTGGFGSVYLACDVLIDKKVAIKVPHKQGEAFDKLLREPRLLAALDHPHIVGVLTAEKTNNVFFIVMEYVEGHSLEQLRRKEKIFPPERALPWFLQICDAMAYAHRKNIIHRDIRPANVLISTENQVKVADLGTSRYLDDNPFASTRIGSPPYMAPEHFQGKATLQSDIYSFGVLMYECLTGRLPFYDKNPRRLAEMVRDQQAEAVHVLNPAVTTALSQIVARAMHRNPGQRYATAEVVQNDLQKLNLGSVTGSSQELAHFIAEEPPVERGFLAKELVSREISRLFCWNCSKPIQKRTQSCPHCSVALD